MAIENPTLYLICDGVAIAVIIALIIAGISAPELGRAHPVRLILAICFQLHSALLFALPPERYEFLEAVRESLSLESLELLLQHLDH